MSNFKSFKSLLYTLNEGNVTDIALQLFQYQAQHNPVYASFIQHLKVKNDTVKSLKDIPFMPISFFKRHEVKTDSWKAETIFASSGTTGMTTSKHYVEDLNFYLNHAVRCFEYFFGSLSQYHFLALMPSYLERSDSSLIAMMNHFMKVSGSPHSRFYLYNYDELVSNLENLKADKSRKIILWGVTFALLDLADSYTIDLSNCLVFETGGMKGRRKEITRTQLHDRLQKALKVKQVFSEYGMTELFSQAYTRGGVLFYPSPWMRVLARETVDPLERGFTGRAGGLNIIDFANVHSVAFIETEDAGIVYPDGSFEVLGRLDNSDVRGCNLLVE